MNRAAKIEMIKNVLKLGAYGTLAGASGEYAIERRGTDKFLVFSEHQLDEEMFPIYKKDMGQFITTVPHDAISKAHFVTPFAMLYGEILKISGWDHRECTLQVSVSQPLDLQGVSFLNEDRNLYTAQIEYWHEGLKGLKLKYTQAWDLHPDEKVSLKELDIDLRNVQDRKDQSIDPNEPASTLDLGFISKPYASASSSPYVQLQDLVNQIEILQKQTPSVQIHTETMIKIIMKLREFGLEDFIAELAEEERKLNMSLI